MFLILLSAIYKIDSYNYENHKTNKRHIVNHPEMLPQKKYAHLMSFWFSNLRANIYWLEAIQYIGSNVISHEYKKYLYHMLDLITELNPYFERPYIIWQLLLPWENVRYENLSKEELEYYNNQAISIWKKWIENFCDKQKIEKIINQDNLEKLWSEAKYKDPCLTHRIPFNQAFIHYFYMNDYKKSSDYYKITSVNSDSLPWAKNMAAVMSWRSWDRLKSTYMFLTMASAEYEENEICMIIGQEINNNLWYIFENDVIDSNIIKHLNNISNEFITHDDEDIFWWSCDFNLNRAIREINLYYLDNANNKYKSDNNKYALSWEKLLEWWYIKYLPRDFQQYENYWIIYFFNNEQERFDYKMWY